MQATVVPRPARAISLSGRATRACSDSLRRQDDDDAQEEATEEDEHRRGGAAWQPEAQRAPVEHQGRNDAEPDDADDEERALRAQPHASHGAQRDHQRDERDQLEHQHEAVETTFRLSVRPNE